MALQQCEVCGRNVGRRFCEFHAVEKIIELEKKLNAFEKRVKKLEDKMGKSRKYESVVELARSVAVEGEGFCEVNGDFGYVQKVAGRWHWNNTEKGTYTDLQSIADKEAGE